MKTQAYPCKEIAPNTYEIGEFDCASMFLLIGEEKAMLIDTGIGIGDLKGFSHLGGGPRGSHRFTSVEKALFYLKRLQDLHLKYDRCFNGHYDFRLLGVMLGEDVLPDAITACEQIVAGTAKVEVRPAALPGFPTKPVVTIGRTNVSFFPDGIREV